MKNLPIAIAAMIITGLFCLGCGEPKLDTSSDQAFATSLEKMYSSVSETERVVFLGYIDLVMEDRDHLKVNPPSCDDIIKLYSLITAWGKKKELERINSLNGLTKNNIITQGKTIWKKGLEEQLAEVDKKIEEANSYAEAFKKIDIELGSVEAGEASSLFGKGKIGSLSVNLTITNGSSLKLKSFGGGTVIFFDENGKEVNHMTAHLSSFIAADESRPFEERYHGGSGLGLEAGKTIKGRLTSKEVLDLPFPTQSKFTAAFTNVPIKPTFDVGYERYGNSAQDTEKELEQLNEKKAQIQADLAKIM